jgi:hypothetical protein
MKERIVYRFAVKDFDCESQTKRFETHASATAWYNYLFEVRPNSRCVIEEIYEVEHKEEL